jgi:hypothetical protein
MRGTRNTGNTGWRARVPLMPRIRRSVVSTCARITWRTGTKSLRACAATSGRHRQTEGSPGRARKPTPACVWDIACGLRGPVRAAGRRLRDLQAIRSTVVRGSLPRHRLGARPALSQLQHGARFAAGRSARGDGGGRLSQGGRACCAPPWLGPRQRLSRPRLGAARAPRARYDAVDAAERGPLTRTASNQATQKDPKYSARNTIRLA